MLRDKDLKRTILFLCSGRWFSLPTGYRSKRCLLPRKRPIYRLGPFLALAGW